MALISIFISAFTIHVIDLKSDLRIKEVGSMPFYQNYGEDTIFEYSLTHITDEFIIFTTARKKNARALLRFDFKDEKITHICTNDHVHDHPEGLMVL